jgi:hypothetical protein
MLLSVRPGTGDGACVNAGRKSRTHRLTSDQIETLLRIVREDSGDNVSRSEFNEAMLLLFENIAGFETLPQRTSKQLIDKLWQEFRAACQSRY